MSRVVLWGAGAMLAAVVGLTGYTILSHDDRPTTPQPAAAPPSPSAVSATTVPVPVSTYSLPATWTEPDHWLAVPRGAGALSGLEVAFPHTTAGAIGMLVACSGFDVEGSRTLVDEELTFYRTYTAAADRSADREQRIRQGAAKTDARARAAMSLPETGPLPAGAWMRSSMVGFKLVQAEPDAVTAHLLLRNARKSGGSSPESVVYVVGTVGVVWREGDWRLDPSGGASPAPATVPEIAAPGDAAFNAQGWTAIRQAS
ncbi:hypothetical protein ACFRAR_14705 [Kitasatospora sp. NPDC056651]|uniref:hypothetical protein n=1 Tax=Kitasatospora sp. NPDC056651 TaxID=3345892 RepID=UPI0036CB08DD